MRLLFVENRSAENFLPIALCRPVFELLCGSRSLRQRFVDYLKPESWGVVIRDSLVDVYQEEFPEAAVNDLDWIEHDEVIMIDGCWLGSPQLIEDPERLKELASTPGSGVQIRQPGDKTLNSLGAIRDASSIAENSETPHLRYPWDPISRNGALLQLDFELFYSGRVNSGQVPSPYLSRVQDKDQVFIDPSVKIEPHVCFNTESGPIMIEAGAVIQAFTRVEGPCYIGPETQLFRANVKGETSFGPVCRIGGEIEASIVHGYSNKYHDGFLGHSYVGPWVNLGALTSNSDLKNDYSTVKFPIGNEIIQTGEKKIGCLIGDHAKTAIGTLFNTGSHVGVMTMVLPGGRLCPKHIPSFSRLWNGQIDDNLDLESALVTAETAMGRRGQSLSAAQRQLLINLYKETTAERAHAIDWARSRNT